MCCFSGAVSSVSNTQLFARRDDTGRQFLVYQMAYQADEPVAMILPLPVALPSPEDALRFIDLKGYPNFFSDLSRAFPISRSQSAERSRSAAMVAPQALEVHSVGDFVVSFVPTLADFTRLDPRFRLPESVWDTLPGYRDYGFAVFQLAELGGTPHPMAFSFPTRLAKGKLFFPTVHIHDGDVHPEERFDHTFYLQGAEGSGELSPEPAGHAVDVVRAKGIVDGHAPLSRVIRRGVFANEDTVFPESTWSRLHGWLR